MLQTIIASKKLIKFKEIIFSKTLFEQNPSQNIFVQLKIPCICN